MSEKISMNSSSTGMNLSDSVYERLLRERIIFLGTQVDDEIANKLCAQILLLSAEDPTRDISLYINSPGGSPPPPIPPNVNGLRFTRGYRRSGLRALASGIDHRECDNCR